MYRCLPPIPTAIIRIPFIRSAIEILRANRTTPMVRGCIKTKAVKDAIKNMRTN